MQKNKTRRIKHKRKRVTKKSRKRKRRVRIRIRKRITKKHRGGAQSGKRGRDEDGAGDGAAKSDSWRFTGKGRQKLRLRPEDAIRMLEERNQELTGCLGELDECRGELTRCRGELKQAKEELGAAHNDRQYWRTVAEKAQKLAEVHRTELEECNRQLEECNRQLKLEQVARNKSAEIQKQMANKIENVNKKCRAAENDLAECRGKLEQAEQLLEYKEFLLKRRGTRLEKCDRELAQSKITIQTKQNCRHLSILGKGSSDGRADAMKSTSGVTEAKMMDVVE